MTSSFKHKLNTVILQKVKVALLIKMFFTYYRKIHCLHHEGKQLDAIFSQNTFTHPVLARHFKDYTQLSTADKGRLSAS
jgi:hypothetical protein